MDALLFCGGRGSRFEAEVEKPLYPIGGEPMVDRVRAALAGSRVDEIYAVVSPAAPAVCDHVDPPVVETPGDGYVADLGVALEAVDPPVLTAPADLPLLAPSNVDAVLDAHAAAGGGSLAVCVPAELKRALGASVDEDVGGGLVPSGLNVVAGDADPGNGSEHDECGSTSDDHGEPRETSWDARLAVNVNRRADAALAERFAEIV